MTESQVGETAGIAQLSGWGGRRSILRGVLVVGCSLLILYLLFRLIDVRQVLSLLGQIPLAVWILATALTVTFPLLSAARWRMILSEMGYDVSTRRCLRIILGVWPVSAISPSKSGDLLKAVSFRGEIRAGVVAGSVITERALDLSVLAILAVGGGVLVGDAFIVLASLGLLVSVGIGIVLMRFSFPFPGGTKVRSLVDDLLESIRLLGRDRRGFAVMLGLTVANWFASILQTKILFCGVGASVPLVFVAAALPVTIFVGLLPITLGGMGTREAAMVVLFGAYATPPQALAVGLLYSFFGYWLPAVLGLPFTGGVIAPRKPVTERTLHGV